MKSRGRLKTVVAESDADVVLSSVDDWLCGRQTTPGSRVRCTVAGRLYTSYNWRRSATNTANDKQLSYKHDELRTWLLKTDACYARDLCSRVLTELSAMTYCTSVTLAA